MSYICPECGDSVCDCRGEPERERPSVPLAVTVACALVLSVILVLGLIHGAARWADQIVAAVK